MTTPKTETMLDRALKTSWPDDLNRAAFAFADFMASETTMTREGYLEITALIKTEINAKAAQQKNWKCAYIAEQITRLIRIRRASKLWAAASHAGDPLMMKQRTQIAAKADKLSQRAAAKAQRAGLSAHRLSERARDLSQIASDLERQAQEAVKKAKEASQAADVLIQRLSFAEYEARAAQHVNTVHQKDLEKGRALHVTLNA